MFVTPATQHVSLPCLLCTQEQEGSRKAALKALPAPAANGKAAAFADDDVLGSDEEEDSEEGSDDEQMESDGESESGWEPAASLLGPRGG